MNMNEFVFVCLALLSDVHKMVFEEEEEDKTKRSLVVILQ